MTVDHLVLRGRSDGHSGLQPIVFVNSLGSDLTIWDGVVSELGSTYHCLRYDKRGHGLSDAPPDTQAPRVRRALPSTHPLRGAYTLEKHTRDLVGVMDEFGVERAAIVGISVGGLIALQAASRHPERVRALVLCDTAARIGTEEGWNERIEAIRQEGLAALAPSIAARWFAPSFPTEEPATFRGHVNMLGRSAAEGYLGTCAMLRDTDLGGSLGSIRCPALVVTGDHDVATPPVMGRALAAVLEHGRFAPIADAGHLPCVEQPEALAGLIRDFLEEVGADA